MRKIIVSVFIALLFGFTTAANAVEDDLFQAIIQEHDGYCDAVTITLNDALAVSIPSDWSEVPQEEEYAYCYQYQEEYVDMTVYAGWMEIPEGVTYDRMQVNLLAMSSVI